MASSNQERLCTRIGRTLPLLSLTLADRDPSRDEEEQAEQQLHSVAEELPQGQPLEEAQATDSGTRQAVPGEGGAEERQVVPEGKDPEKQRQMTKDDSSSGVSEEVLTTTEDIQEEVSPLPSCSLENVEVKRRKLERGQVLNEPEAGTSSQLAKTQVEEALPSHQQVGGDSEREEANMKYMVKCPLFRIPEVKCMWTGRRQFLLEHVIEIHKDIYKKGHSFPSKSFTNDVRILHCFDDLFLYYKYFTDSGFMYVFMQPFGIPLKRFRCTIEIVSTERNIDDIKYCFRMRHVTVPFEDLVSEKRCMVLDKRRLKHFTVRDTLSMYVNVTPIFEFRESLIREQNHREGKIQKQKFKIDVEKVECPLLGDQIVKCPMVKNLFSKCIWSGKATILVQHLLAEHSRFITRDPEFLCRRLVKSELVILYNDEVFLYSKRVSFHYLYAVVQQVGLTREKYQYTVEFSAEEDKDDNITFTLNPCSIDLPIEDIIHDFDCMAIDIDRLLPYRSIIEEIPRTGRMDVNMKVRITRADTQQGALVTGADDGENRERNVKQEEKSDEEMPFQEN